MAAYISELAYAGGTSADFVEIAAPKGIDVSGYTVAIYNSAGNVVGTFSLGSAVNTVSGTDVYVIDSGTPGFTSFGTTDSIALVDDLGNVVQFVSWSNNTTSASSGPAAGMTSTDIGTAPGTSSLETGDGGSSYSTQTTSNSGTIPCYAPGTLIDTPHGPRAVETLKLGDMVMTLDNGPQAIRWTRSSDHSLEKVKVDAKPVLIAAGALGRGLPAKDLIVSPQHRMLVGGCGQLEGEFETEAIVPAKSLTTLRGIRHMQGKNKITWVHFACDQHEVIIANGCFSESLLLSPLVVNGLDASERRTLADIFGPAQSGAGLNGDPARKPLTVGEVRRLLHEPLKETRQTNVLSCRGWDRDSAMERYGTERVHNTQERARFAETASFVG